MKLNELDRTVVAIDEIAEIFKCTPADVLAALENEFVITREDADDIWESME